MGLTLTGTRTSGHSASHFFRTVPVHQTVLRPTLTLITRRPASLCIPLVLKRTSFYDAHFPYAVNALPKVLDEEWDSLSFAKYRNSFPEVYRNSRQDFEAHFNDLVNRDVKIAYLKSLQGYLWEQGYRSGAIRAPLFDDVAPFFQLAHKLGKKIVIYSSGSVAAQKLLFAHTNAEPSDMTHLISEWFDTVNAGPKMEVDSYRIILSSFPKSEPKRWLFLSDNLQEVTAAIDAGIRSVPVIRPGNAPLPPHNSLSKLAITEFKHDPDLLD